MIRTGKWVCVKVSRLLKLAVQNYIKTRSQKNTLILYSVNPHFLCNISTKDPNCHAPSEEEAEEWSQSNLSTADKCRLPSPQPAS